MTHHTRRDFMRLACCSAATASLVGGLSKFGLVSALAQGTTDYKALVCVFLFGGNDSNNMIVPIDTAGYTNYQTIRANLALSAGIPAAAADRKRRQFRVASEPSGPAGLVQQSESAGGAEQRRHAGATDHAAAVSESKQPAAKSVLALGPAEPVADDAAQRHPECRLGRQSGGQGDADIQQQRAVPADPIGCREHDFFHRDHHAALHHESRKHAGLEWN